MPPSIITLAEYKSLQGIQAGQVRDDAQISALLPAASRAVRTYAGRAFEITTGIATVRSFQYDESGFLDIDDATIITSISTDAGLVTQTYALDTTEWTAMPQDDSDVFYYVLIHGGPYFGGSPEMGFQRNLDRYPISPRQPLMSVTATWGWPVIPDDVKLATALTVGELVAAPGKSEGLTSESIEGYARVWGSRTLGGGGGSASLNTALPNRARDLLASYQRVFI